MTGIIVKLWFATLVLTLVASCQSGPRIEASKDAGLKEVRLGESRYYLMLPPEFVVKEARGKEGQLGYSLMPADPATDIYGFIEIKSGQGAIRGNAPTSPRPHTYATADLDNRSVTWTIEQTENGTFSAYTTESGELNARASSKKREEVDRMISYIATLRTK